MDHKKESSSVPSVDPLALVCTASSNMAGSIEGVRPQCETKRMLKSRHAQMIAIGGTIGTGLFVGVGQGLAIGGPLFLLLSYIVLAITVYGVVTATTEMSAYLPVPGSSMAYYGSRFFSPSLGFAMGWMYVYVFAITVPAEITATALVINYWHPPVDVAVWITITGLVMIGLNCFSARVYGEAEFWFASVKIAGIIMLLTMALVLVCGGGPNHEAYGFRYWRDPGSVNMYLVEGASGRLCAFVATITFSAYAFVFAPELLVVTGGEMENPRHNLPIAGRRYFYRLIIFYVLGVFFIGLITASNDPRLVSGEKGATASPWAIAANTAGIRVLDSVINAVIVTSAWSAGNSYLYLASRALYSLARTGSAPKIFSRCTRRGIPHYSLIATSSLSLLAYLNVGSSSSVVFNWFVNLVNTGGYQSWICCGIVYLRFRKATHVQAVTGLPFRSVFQPYLTYFTITVCALLMLLTGFKVFVDGNWTVSAFLTSYLGIPIFGFLYFGHKLTVGQGDAWCHRAEDVDLFSGLDEIRAEEIPLKESDSKWYMKWKVILG